MIFLMVKADGQGFLLNVVARLRTGATVAGTVSELNVINERVHEGLPATLKWLLGGYDGAKGQAQALLLLHDDAIGKCASGRRWVLFWSNGLRAR